jgi:DNA replication protein DnaC
MARRRSRGVNSVIPERYRDVSFTIARNEGLAPPIVGMVEEFTREIEAHLDEGRGLWLTGEVARGKTALAMLVSKAALEAGRTVAIYSAPKLMMRIRATYGDDRGDGLSYVELFERLTEVDLLHVDDLGVEKRTDWVLEQLYAIINERYERKRSVLVTTNADQATLEAQVGERIVSRLVEMCGSPLAVGGADLRYPRAPEY